MWSLFISQNMPLHKMVATVANLIVYYKLVHLGGDKRSTWSILGFDHTLGQKHIIFDAKWMEKQVLTPLTLI